MDFSRGACKGSTQTNDSLKKLEKETIEAFRDKVIVEVKASAKHARNAKQLWNSMGQDRRGSQRQTQYVAKEQL